MSKFKSIITEFDDDFGRIEFNGNGEIFLATSSMPELFGIDSTEESLADYFSKFKMEGEDRNFEWDKDLPKGWKLVEVEIKVVDKFDVSSFVENYINNLEEWEELTPQEAAIVESIVHNEEIEPFEINVSLHVSESKYKVDDDIIRFIGAIGDKRENYKLERLKNK